MANLANDTGKAMPAGGSLDRPTHRSLPKLTIQPYRGPDPIEIPPGFVPLFIEVISANREVPLSVCPPSLARILYPTHTSFIRNEIVEHPDRDPYLVDLPTPDTLQFTANDALEMSQWRQVAGNVGDTHCELMRQYLEDPTNSKVKKDLREIRAMRQNIVESIDKILERRAIRRRFRRDFNHREIGW
ncbi:hypothetical protein F4808DRAFT_474761 [Astrocystis sublimbata]|nr:hypothetical protein F4808DRAFT_474761 [Astrocystis sublimbata]